MQNLGYKPWTSKIDVKTITVLNLFAEGEIHLDIPLAASAQQMASNRELAERHNDKRSLRLAAPHLHSNDILSRSTTLNRQTWFARRNLHVLSRIQKTELSSFCSYILNSLRSYWYHVLSRIKKTNWSPFCSLESHKRVCNGVTGTSHPALKRQILMSIKFVGKSKKGINRIPRSHWLGLFLDAMDSICFLLFETKTRRDRPSAHNFEILPKENQKQLTLVKD